MSTTQVSTSGHSARDLLFANIAMALDKYHNNQPDAGTFSNHVISIANETLGKMRKIEKTGMRKYIAVNQKVFVNPKIQVFLRILDDKIRES